LSSLDFHRQRSNELGWETAVRRSFGLSQIDNKRIHGGSISQSGELEKKEASRRLLSLAAVRAESRARHPALVEVVPSLVEGTTEPQAATSQIVWPRNSSNKPAVAGAGCLSTIDQGPMSTR